MGLSLRGSTSGAIDINAPAVAGDNAITLPTSNGSANQFFKNSGTAGIVTYSSMVETSTGVGIGSTQPTTNLDVYGYTELDNLNVSGVSTFGTITASSFGAVSGTTGTFSGSVSIGGTLTYEDVTSIDSVGIITAQSGVHVTSGNVGIGTDNPISTLQIKHGGEERIFLTTAGRVGMGITTPATQLEVNSHALLGNIYNGTAHGSINNNTGLVLLHKLGQGKGFYFAGDIIVMSWTGQAKIDCILSANYSNDTLGYNVRDNGTGGTGMITKSTVKYGTVTYDGGTWVCLKKDGGGTGILYLNGYIASNAPSHLPNGVQTLEITSGYSSFSSSVTLN